MFLASSFVCLAQGPAFQLTHKGSVINVKFSPDGTKLASYSSGNQDIGLWDVKSGRLIWKRSISFIQKRDEYYTLAALAWSPDQRLIATASGNGTVQLWDARTGAFTWIRDVAKKDIAAIVFSPDGKTLAATPYSGETHAATLLDVETGEVKKTFIGSQCTQVAVAFNSTGNEVKIGNLDGNVGAWNVMTGKPNVGYGPECRTMPSYGGERSFSEDLSLSVRRTAADGVVIEESNGKVVAIKTLNDSRMKSEINSREKIAIISEYAGYHFFNLASGEDRMLEDCVSGSAFDLSTDGHFFAQSCDGFKTAIKVTNLASGEVSLLDGHPSTIHAISYSPDYSLLAIAGNDGNAYLLDPKTKKLTKTLAGGAFRLTALRFTSDGRTLVTGDEHGTLHQWDVLTGKLVKEVKLNDRSDEIKKIYISNDERNFIVLINEEVMILDQDLTPRGYLNTADGYRETSGEMTITSSFVPIQDVDPGVTGSRVITGHRDGTIRIWDTATARQIQKFKIADRLIFVAAPNSKSIVAVAETGKHTNIKLFDRSSGKVLRQSKNIDGSFLERMSMSPDGRIAALTDISGDTTICDLRTMTLREVDNGLSGSDSVAFSRDGDAFFIGGENQNLALFDTSNGKKLWQLIPDFQPSQAETKLSADRKIRIDALTKIKTERDKQSADYIRKFRNRVFVTFEHYGDMSDPGEKRMVESDAVKESKTTKTRVGSNAVWLRLYNDSTLPIEVPTVSMYLPDPKCVFQFPNGEKMHGLCKDREIGVWFGVKDTQGKWVPYGFDFGSSVILLPNSSVVFPVPRSIWDKSYFVVFDYSFQNVRASENDREMDFGKKIELKVSKQNLRKQ